MFYLYIIQSIKDGSYYIGSTESIVKRLNEHNFGNTRYTKNKRPWKLVYQDEYMTRSEAVIREKYLKRMKSKKYIENLINTIKGP